MCTSYALNVGEDGDYITNYNDNNNNDNEAEFNLAIDHITHYIICIEAAIMPA